MTSSKEKLAQALTHAELYDMAEQARAGYYHDFESPLDAPAVQLDIDLMHAIKAGNDKASLIRQWHHDGQFDATLDESEAWANSPEGREAFEQLQDGDPPEAARERLRVAALMGEAIRHLAAAIPNTAITILIQRPDADNFDCATTLRQSNLVDLLRAYADHIATLKDPLAHDA